MAQEQIVESRLRVADLQRELAAERAKYWQLFDEMPQPYVVTRPDSVIVEANRAGAELFNVSQRFLVGKAMSVFVCEDRARFLLEIDNLAKEAASRQLRRSTAMPLRCAGCSVPSRLRRTTDGRTAGR